MRQVQAELSRQPPNNLAVVDLKDRMVALPCGFAALCIPVNFARKVVTKLAPLLATAALTDQTGVQHQCPPKPVVLSNKFFREESSPYLGKLPGLPQQCRNSTSSATGGGGAPGLLVTETLHG
eukprot:1510136-Amphidinium_carterae.1